MLITVLDTETTGLDYKQHEIIQFAAVRFFLNEDTTINIVDKVDLKVKPKNIELASYQALKINGYTEQTWIGSLPMECHLNVIEQFIANSDLLLGQNLIFDLRFIQRAFTANQKALPKFPRYIDTRQMANNLVQKGILKNASMDRLCEHYQVKVYGRSHTALTDCHRTLSVWMKLSKETDMDFFTFEEPYEKNKK
jgi:DNA polymerase III epsilon subunit-like protein